MEETACPCEVKDMFGGSIFVEGKKVRTREKEGSKNRE
jgi:hypothetical protein